MAKKLVLIDGHSILNRAFYGVPDLTNSQGMHTNAVYGFLNIMFKILEEENPDYLAVAFDVHAKTFRHEMYEAYKGTRKSMPEELREQVPMMKEVLKAMNVVIMEQAGLEADDILGTLAKKAQRDGMEVSLVSGDRDLLQIATDHIKIRIPKTKMGRTEIEDYYEEDVVKAYQVTPLQFIELKALMGDTADNIPGVPKVGTKTATDLMVQYGSIDNIYAHLDEISKKSIRETLAANRDLADLSKTLATIKIDCDLELDYRAAEAKEFYTKEAYALFKKLEFKNMLGRFEKQESAVDHRIAESFRVLENVEALEKLLEQNCGRAVGFIPVWWEKEIYGGAFSFGDSENYFLYLERETASHNEEGQLSFFTGENCELGISQPEKEETGNEVEAFRKLLHKYSGDERNKVYTFDIKPQYDLLAVESTDRYFDILIGAYLLNPLKSDYEPDTIASEHLDFMIPARTEVFGKKSLPGLWNEDNKKVVSFYCYNAFVALKAGAVLEEKLKEQGMDALMKEIEMPLSFVLYDMEREGIRVKADELKAYGDALISRIEQLEESIWNRAGKKFNILSPKQLGEVLFEDLQIPGGKKTKTGYSTAADVLEKLATEYPIVTDILEYRGLTKLKSTYADGLATYIDGTGKIHTSLNQTITATGRISSTEPNLQNIPMRMELGRRIRKVFVPQEGNIFLDADYSQIELRVLAHMSQDEQLIEAYQMDADIHRITASKVFHTPFEEVTDLQRRNAKAVNFGIVYGISSFGLSQDLSITPKEAAAYIEQYFETYPKVKDFLNRMVEDTKKAGYCTTMFGRRRPVPEINASNFMQRSFGERVAMNSPIQGTAADIMKIAMIKVWKAFKEEKLQSKLILQVHDELLIETVPKEEEAVRRILQEKMKGAVELAVALEIDVHSGNDWFEAK